MATPFRFKRSAVAGKRPSLTDLELGEIALNTYDGKLYAERETNGVGIADTVALLNPWEETYGGGSIEYVGTVTATTYTGDQVIGTPNGGFKTGAISISNTDVTKDSINDLNNILGKLVPDAPDTINGAAVDLTNDTEYYLCAGFTPTNNTGGAAPNQTGATAYVRNTTSQVTTDWLTEYGPGDAGTVKGFINAVGVGTTTLSTANNDGTYDKLVIANNEDASNSTRNPGITSQFYDIYDARLLNAASPDGYNKAYFTQDSSTTGSTYWYEDPSTVVGPDMTFGTVSPPSSPTLSYSSYVPHYTEAAGNAFSYQITVTNATGDMYYSNDNRLLWAESQTTGFTRPDQYKLFNETFVSGTQGTHPPQRNWGVGTGATCTATHTPRNIHATITSNHFHRWDCWTPYGNDQNERATISEAVNIMGTTADYTSNVDEDAIECTVGSLTGGSATRVKAGATGDTPTATYTSWDGNASGTPAVYESIVRGGDLRHDQTNYSTGYLPAGPNLSSGRGGSQYFQFQFIQSSISQFNISYTGALAGCWVCMPDNSTWTNGLSNTNGWANMFASYAGAGVPNNANPGCATGGVMDTNGGTFTCTFGTESSSNDSNNRVLIRFKLTSGNSISDISLSDT
jgi:hypothetical protein